MCGPPTFHSSTRCARGPSAISASLARARFLLARASIASRMAASRQGLTPVHFSAQLEPCLSQENTLNNLNIP